LSPVTSKLTLKPKTRTIAASTFAILTTFITAATTISAAHAYLEDYTPLTKQDKRNKIVLKTVSDKGLKDSKPIKIAGAEMVLPTEGDDIVFRGKDKSGKPWTLTKHYHGLGTSFFTRDLDQNGTQDIILLQATGACGIAPPAVITTIMFDKSNRPFPPLEVSGYFAADDDACNAKKPTAKIDDLFTIGSDKRAVLVCNQLDSATVGGRDHSYWRILMYRANSGGWERLKTYNEKTLPMYVRYTMKPNLKTIPPPVPSLKVYDDCALTPTQEKHRQTSQITGIKLNDEGKISRLEMGKTTVDNTSSWPFFQPFLIKDGKDKTEIFAVDSKEGQSLLQEAAKTRASVQFTRPAVAGRYPQYMWLK